MFEKTLLYTFPFEGNWNGFFIEFLLVIGQKTCYTLSRLKGIETRIPFIVNSSNPLAIHFPVWRELKPCYLSIGLCAFGEVLLYTFPFEGNWNVDLTFRYSRICYLLYTFPFEGNWNKNVLRAGDPSDGTCYTLSRLKGIETATAFLEFPSPPLRILLYTFPFEGNWNYSTDHILHLHQTLTCYTLSRLKGIETKAPLAAVSNFFNLLYTFPFEGNWNRLP